MRRSYFFTLILTLAFLALPAVIACGTSTQSAASAEADLSTPLGVLQAAAEAFQDMKSVAGDFEMVVSLEVDPAAQTGMPEGLGAGPLKVAGSFAAAEQPQAFELALTVSGLGDDMSLAMKMADSRAYLGMGEQWYELPAEVMSQLGGSDPDKVDEQAVQDILKETGIDPAAWVNDIKQVGEEAIAGTTCYHLAGAPDMRKVMADLLKLLQSDAFGKLLSRSGPRVTGPTVASLLPQGEELESLPDQVATAFQELTFDVWVSKESLLFKKVALGARLVPPTGTQDSPVKSVALTATVNLDPGAAVKIELPATAKPLEDLQKDLMNNPGLLPFLGGAGQE